MAKIKFWLIMSNDHAVQHCTVLPKIVVNVICMLNNCGLAE